jgi:hypothetical protein
LLKNSEQKSGKSLSRPKRYRYYMILFLKKILVPATEAYQSYIVLFRQIFLKDKVILVSKLGIIVSSLGFHNNVAVLHL